MAQNSLTLLVTVGTTQFDGLVSIFSDKSVVGALAEAGVRKLVVQHGRSTTFDPTAAIAAGMTVDAFDYKSSLEPMIADADIVVSHAAMGTLLHVLSAVQKGSHKLFVVVANRDLSADHQKDCADMIQSHTATGEWNGRVFFTFDEAKTFILSDELGEFLRPLAEIERTSTERIFGYPSNRTGLAKLIEGMM